MSRASGSAATNHLSHPVPAVSVLLPVFNGAPTLQRAAESILRQTFNQLELLILDDGSTDDSARIAEALEAGDPRVRVVRNSRNLGLSATLNRGLAEARAPLLARMDADDEALPDRLEIQVAYMEKHPEVDVLGGGAILVDEVGVERGVQTRAEHHGEIYRRAFVQNPFIHPTVMMRRGFLEALGGYDESLGYPGDYDLWLRGVDRFKYHNLPRPLIRYELPSSFSQPAILSGISVLTRRGFSTGRPLAGLWGGIRYGLAHLLNRWGLRRLRFSDPAAP